MSKFQTFIKERAESRVQQARFKEIEKEIAIELVKPYLAELKGEKGDKGDDGVTTVVHEYKELPEDVVRSGHLETVKGAILREVETSVAEAVKASTAQTKPFAKEAAPVNSIIKGIERRLSILEGKTESSETFNDSSKKRMFEFDIQYHPNGLLKKVTAKEI